MRSYQISELQLKSLEAKRHALDMEAEFILEQYSSCMPCEPGMDHQQIVGLRLAELNRDKANLVSEIAQKELEIFHLQGRMIAGFNC